MQVYCDMENDGGGWTVFQRRMDGSQDFLLGWQQCAAGFGNLTGEFWLGNRNLNFLTGLRPHELKITLMDWEGQTRYAHYDAFSVGAEADKFPLTLGDYSGDAGDSMAHNNGRRFSTVDQDNDHHSGDCASALIGAWWHGYCTRANLNGLYLRGSYSGNWRGVFWKHWRGRRYSLRHTEMKMRRL
ncbi:hypothetical protein CAPTEDRAFT_150062 [Capitella teleta]|uniref:Fibrinogen C-terminal domain-containing protein n=1 Tax=Capitella teleta TaxID=283909 RepID=R7T3M4_CAPTE|nr:hypothetical protein CAPTEDRAFT_150062 [Capitella teleta]|eukprot:ELT87313.1 hypothetical protein CAPTEDRAFT_150062 [Capitella teleta]